MEKKLTATTVHNYNGCSVNPLFLSDLPVIMIFLFCLEYKSYHDVKGRGDTHVVGIGDKLEAQ